MATSQSSFHNYECSARPRFISKRSLASSEKPWSGLLLPLSFLSHLRSSPYLLPNLALILRHEKRELGRQRRSYGQKSTVCWTVTAEATPGSGPRLHASNH